MTFTFKDKDKAKQKAKPNEREDEIDQSHQTKSNDRPSSSQGLFSSFPRSKSLRKKRSLPALLESSPATQADPLPSAPQAARAFSSDDAASIDIPSTDDTKHSALQILERLEAHRKMQIEHPPAKPPNAVAANVWSRRGRMKLHADPLAPYMQGYNHISLDSPSFHDLNGHEPVQVLDLGCGPGYWMLDAASHWKRALITGVDMIDVLVPEARDHKKIFFRQGNFLMTPWPFENKTFDYVRMANLGLCIPYDKWEVVISEVHRVLRVNGRLEFIDDEVIFPYLPPPHSRPTSFSSSSHTDVSDGNDDVASVYSDTTLNGDNNASPSSHTKRLSSGSHSAPDTPGDVPQETILPPPPAAEHPDDVPMSPRSTVTARPAQTPPNYPPEWSKGAAASRDMETVFRNMLQNRYTVHDHPERFIVEVINHVFGNGEKTKSYHLKLAPKNAQKDFPVTDYFPESDGSKEKEEVSVDDLKKMTRGRSWFGSDSDRREKRRSKKFSSMASTLTGTSPPLDTSIPEGLASKAAERLGIRDIQMAFSPVPVNVSAKAAQKLGIPISGEQEYSQSSPSSFDDSNDDETPSPSRSSSPAPLDNVTSAESSPSDKRQSSISVTNSFGDSKLSAKAANRLGISYSELSEATALAKAATRRPLSSTSTLVTGPSAPIQSPGVIVWPNQFIPLAPAELEMHALRSVHTLIGCGAALADYVSTFLDEEGNVIKSVADFEVDLWDYECFRRRRLNWPVDISPDWDPDPELDESASAATSKPGSDKSTTHRNSMIFDISPDSVIPDGQMTPLSKPDELTHLRSIRIYQAVKTSDYTLSTMQTPRSPPPSPPR
ncbi:hypothetical protein H0H93_005779 [Arthromyces matolae]|nr:hypothetical protein H0H93_005779 [Arthromyces matolae]